MALSYLNKHWILSEFKIACKQCRHINYTCPLAADSGTMFNVRGFSPVHLISGDIPPCTPIG